MEPLDFDHQGNMDDWLIIEKIEDVAVGTSVPCNYENPDFRRRHYGDAESVAWVPQRNALSGLCSVFLMIGVLVMLDFAKFDYVLTYR